MNKKLLVTILFLLPLPVLAINLLRPQTGDLLNYTLDLSSSGLTVSTTTDPTTVIFQVPSVLTASYINATTTTATSIFSGGFQVDGSSLFSTTTVRGALNIGTLTATSGTSYLNALTLGTKLPNSELANSAVTVNSTSPLTGGGAVSLGNTITIACGTCDTFAYPFTPTSVLGTTRSGTTSDIFTSLGYYASSSSNFASTTVMGSFNTGTLTATSGTSWINALALGTALADAYISSATAWNAKADLGSAMTGTFDGNNFAGGAIGLGELIYGGSAGSFSELTVGTAGNVLSMKDGIPAWVATSTCAAITGSADLCDGSDATGSGNPNLTINTIGANKFIGASTTALVWSFPAGHISNGSSTNAGTFVVTNGNLGIGTTTPYGSLSIAVNTPPAELVIATSTSAGATSLLEVNASPFGNKDWARVAVGTTTTYNSATNGTNTIGALYPLSVVGAIYSTKKEFFCDSPQQIAARTADALLSCGGLYDFDEDNQGAASLLIEPNGTFALAIWAGLTAGYGVTTTAGDGSAIVLPSLQMSASSSLWYQASVLIPDLAGAKTPTSSTFAVGFSDKVTGADWSTWTAGTNNCLCFIASSTQPNWVAMAMGDNAGSVPEYNKIDTGVATTTLASTTQYQIMTIHAWNTSDGTTTVEYFINGVYLGSQKPVAPIKKNLSPFVSVGSNTGGAGTSKSFRISYIRAWADLDPNLR